MLLILEVAWHGELFQRRSYRSRQRWSRSKAKEGPSQNKDEYCRLHWISHTSLKTPKDMFDAMKQLVRRWPWELNSSMWRCNVRKHSMLLHKEILDQGGIRSHWRQCQRSRSIDYNLEWYSKFSRRSCSRRKITYGRMRVRRRLIDGKRRRDGRILTTHA